MTFTGVNNFTYDFSDYKTFKELFRGICYRNISINKTEQKQDEFTSVLNALSKYSQRDQKYIEAKNKLLDSAKNFYKGRKKIIEGLKNKIFPIYHDDEDSRFEDNGENDIRDNNGLIDYKNLERIDNIKVRDIDNVLVKRQFLVQDLGALLEK